ncbi:MAG: hypothetical protein O2955_08580 [Planctomycetota bacterium]|nr:hypothetical protein [Planctomycetota bacterium]MDA1212560.1 hypothetical protein [Planctomycetota bacterium]
MWEGLNQYLLLLAITSPLVGMVAIALISRGGSNAMALREAVVIHAILTAGFVGLLVIQYRVPTSLLQSGVAIREIPAVQMQGAFRWIGDPVRHEPKHSAKQHAEDELSSPMSLLPIVRMAWGIDGVSLCFVVMTALVMIPSLLSPVTPAKYGESHAVSSVCLLGCSFSLLGIFSAQDVVWLIACVGMLIGFSAFLLATHGGVDRRNVMTRCVARWGMGTLAGGLALIGIVYAFSWMQVWSGESAFLPEFVWPRVRHDLVSLRYIDPVAEQVWRQTAPAIGLTCLVGAWAWLPMFPLHRRWISFWRQSSSGLRFVWMCVGSQLGLFILVQYVLPVFGPLEETTIWWSGLLGLIGFLYAQAVMARQQSFLGAISYGLIAQQGLCFAALICGERAALWGGLLQIVNVSLSVSLLVWQKLQEPTANNTVPSWCGRVALGSLSGMPGTLGFVSQLLILWGLFGAPVAGEIVLLTLVGLVFGGRLWQRATRLPYDEVLPSSEITATSKDSMPSIGIGAAYAYALVVAGGLILVGVQPALMLNRLRPSTEQLALAGMPVSTPAVTESNGWNEQDEQLDGNSVPRDREP